MEKTNVYDIIILGSGPAGLTAGIYAVRAGRKTLLIAGSKWGGQLMLTTLVENFPGFAHGIQGPELMANMRKQAKNLGVEILNSDFSKVDFSQKPFKVTAADQIYEGKSVIITTGADSLWLNIPGEEQFRGKGISVCATCDAFFFRGKNVIVVGGGDTAMEEALHLAKVAKSVTIIHRRDSFRASQAMQEKVFAEPKIRIIWNAEVIKFNGKDKLESINSKLKVQSAKLKLKTQNRDITVSVEDFENKMMQDFGGGKILSKTDNEITWQIPIDGVFIAIGQKPNTDKLKGLELDAKGYISRREIKDESGLTKYQSATSLEGVFVAGDAFDYRYRQAIVAAGWGAIAALDADRWLEEEQK